LKCTSRNAYRNDRVCCTVENPDRHMRNLLRLYLSESSTNGHGSSEKVRAADEDVPSSKPTHRSTHDVNTVWVHGILLKDFVQEFQECRKYRSRIVAVAVRFCTPTV